MEELYAIFTHYCLIRTVHTVAKFDVASAYSWPHVWATPHYPRKRIELFLDKTLLNSISESK